MTSTFDLPTTDVAEPETRDQLVSIVRENAERREPIYPVGGGTSLEYGLPARQPGRVVHLSKLDGLIDYPARDMTITVEAGMTMGALRRILAEQGQEIPLDAALAEQATLGGVLATNFSGPRRYGHGTARDYVIGIRAVDGRGMEFSGGGRVVKNVAGYDFCKMLIGSLGTIGIITEVTFKVKPCPLHRAFVGCPIDLSASENVLAALPQSDTYPSIVAWIGGSLWHDVEPLSTAARDADWIVVSFEGTQGEVAWMTERLQVEWQALGVENAVTWSADQADPMLTRMIEFPNLPESALTVKASVVPSGVTSIIQAAREREPDCSILAHAGNGIVIARFADVPDVGLAATLTRYMRPVAAAHQGSVVVLSGSHRDEWTRQLVWGGIDAPLSVMSQIKNQFDPHAILNPGRFVYS